MGSRFSESLFLDVLGTATEQVQTCEFRRNSSSLDKAPRSRDSVLLNSLESFLVTLPSIPSKIWSMCSSAIPDQVCFVTDCSLYFLVFLSFLSLLPQNSYDSEGKTTSVVKTELIFICNKMSIASIMREKVFNKGKQLLISNRVQYLKATFLYNIISTFVSPSYTFSLAGNINVYTPIRGSNGEKYFNHIIYKGKMPTLVGNKHLSVHFFFHTPRFFHLPTEEGTGLIRQKWTLKELFPRRHSK